MKIATIVGARPQFIKVAAVSRFLRLSVQEVLVHTGQHFDYNMSEIFFNELGIPNPDYNLGISGGTHGKMTGEMLIGLEQVLLNENPDAVLVYGDTNSTIAGALAAAKLHIPVCHVEAGNRLGTLDNPEELNRVCTDHISTKLLACTQAAMDFLAKENIVSRAELVGDPMFDAFCYYGKLLNEKNLEAIESLHGMFIDVPTDFYYLTCHREENTNEEALKEILKAMNSLDAPTIYPVHPRSELQVEYICKKYNFTNILLVKPVGYLTSLALVKHAIKIVTDSGGLQREAFFSGKQCVFVFDYAAWPETMVGNRNQLSKPDTDDILQKLSKTQVIDPTYQPFGNGHASEKITAAIMNMQKSL